MFYKGFRNKKRHPFRSYHLRNLSLFHSANVWSLVHRGYPIADYEYHSQFNPHWIGFEDMSYFHVLRPKPRLNDHPKKLYKFCIQLSLFDEFDLNS